MEKVHPTLLTEIKSPEDLRRLPEDKLPEVCQDIRRHLIDQLANNPGHFASSMGAVDIIVALHYVFNTPHDRIVFDVGHQAYAHKLLTGRQEAFATQRTLNGISGFPTPMESPYDTFMAGHASNSISAALGMAIADKLTPGSEDKKTIALIGDASISGGLAFEGLNNAANNPNDLLIILNDNEMSIDNNVGALHRYLSDLSTSMGYNKLRKRIYDAFRTRGYIGERGKGRILRFNNSLKALISKQQNIFEGLNIRYFGPFDGNDVNKVVKVLREIKDMKGPRILHLHTVKGKGFPKAEEDPTTWHAPGKFNPDNGERHPKPEDAPPLWQEVFGRTLVKLAGENEKIVGITAAMPSGTSMGMMLKAFPQRTFDVGISEGHAVTFAGGLAAAGKHPVVAIYSSFLQRAYDNIIHDVAIQGLPVTFCIDRAGLVGEDGVTHHGLFDMVYLRCIPGMAIAAPMDGPTLQGLMVTAVNYDGPMAIRYPRGKTPAIPPVIKDLDQIIPQPVGKGRIINLAPGARMAILSIGEIGNEASKALKDIPFAVDHYDMIWVKPLDEDLMKEICERYEVIITVEDGVRDGGFGSAVAQWLSEHKKGDGKSPKLIQLGVPDRWITQGSIAELRHLCGIDSNTIREALIKESQRLTEVPVDTDASTLSNVYSSEN
ncbi:MAG: 1-deoxy-D-xylulose-5-phosphate synthase [Muribaculaceae bacterium]|nr:1-deoxy-D-xylulose-5-phosphate synthase [Muribaculaceae bacterium]